DGATIYYCHLAARTVREGQTVRKGDQLGIEGSTGQSTGVHLHFEVRRGNERINAAEYLGIPNEPGTYHGIAPTSGSSSGVINSIVERMNNV
ncbi:MAG: M23 family metallopeptidase, partial [Candidatus Flemingiibacterium sp.]